MLRRCCVSEKGEITTTIGLWLMALVALFLLIHNIVSPPKIAADLSVSLANCAIYNVPMERCCKVEGILKNDAPVIIEVIDKKGDVVTTIIEAKVWSATDKEIALLLRPQDSQEIPPLAVNDLRVILKAASL